MEIREPFGSGIDKYRGTEAIRRIPPRPRQTLFWCIFPRAQVQPELGPTNQRFQCTVALRCGQARRRTGCIKWDARKYRPVRKYCTRVVSGVLPEGTTSREQFPGNMLSSLCARPLGSSDPSCLRVAQKNA